MSYTVLTPDEAFWRPSNQMRIANTDLAAQLGATQLGVRLWRLEPGQASTWHRHVVHEEVYVVLEGTGRLRVDGGSTLTLPPGSAVRVDPDTLRQAFNDTAATQLWLVMGAPGEPANTLAMTPELVARLYPEGPRRMPPELGGGEFVADE
ncbi:MAG: cupin domain-containing protein [Thermoleophilia bacterium]|nr:cupin domain-containing protein [Thermoleophilia bacterium]